MTIPDLLVRDQRWPDRHGPWRTQRTFTAATMTLDELYEVCYRLGLKPKIHFQKKGDAE